MGALSRLGNCISTEQGFRRASLVGFGVPAAVAGAWAFKDYGEPAWLLVVPGAALAAYLWGTVMWKLVFRDIYVSEASNSGEKGVRGPR
jgi:hypothetical protein